MTSIVFYFHAHQPRRIRYYSFFDIGNDNFFNDDLNRRILDRVVNKCYIPSLTMFKEYIEKIDLKLSFSITGTLIEQLEIWYPDVLNLWAELVDSGNVEIVAEPYYHSLTFLIDIDEFKSQIKQHRKKIKEIFGYKPRTFRNFELSYSNEIAHIIYSLGFRIALTEGFEKILGWRSPNFVYKAKGVNVRLMLRNYRLSDDIAFRFANPYWEEYPLTAEKYYSWLCSLKNSDVINIFMDFETLGEHLWKESGIFEFFKKLLDYISKDKDFNTMTITEAAFNYEPKDEIDVPFILSWADEERDLSAWLADGIQKEAFEYLKQIYYLIKENNDEELLKMWRYLSTSDHLYYMSLKFNADGTIHNYFREESFETPYDAFISFMNILRHIETKLNSSLKMRV